MEDDFFTRARARETTTAERTARQTGGVRPLIGAMVVAFLLGVGVTGYFAWREDIKTYLDGGETVAEPTGDEVVPPEGEPTPSPSARASEGKAVAAAAQAVRQVAQQQGGLEQRVTAMEQRIDQLNLQAEAAAGNTARAEGLLIAFAARRAVDRGEPLGYLADQLKLRFGDARPNAVQTIIAASERPLTVDQLLARLEGLGPILTNDAKADVSWDWFKNELSDLFVIRRETSPSPLPERRLARARRFLESGRIEAAVAEVRNLPRAQEASQWIADAQRYADAQRALDLLETTAILDSRDLRDGNGKKVKQLSPASDKQK